MNKDHGVSRKRFLAWGLTIPAFLALPAFLRGKSKSKTTATVKMLTQDGKLVTLHVQDIPEHKEKIKPEEIHNWISRK
ncbi:MAG: hypothetical protein ACO1OO_09990 [Flavisolibacter sp.]